MKDSLFTLLRGPLDLVHESLAGHSPQKFCFLDIERKQKVFQSVFKNIVRLHKAIAVMCLTHLRAFIQQSNTNKYYYPSLVTKRHMVGKFPVTVTYYHVVPRITQH